MKYLVLNIFLLAFLALTEINAQSYYNGLYQAGSSSFGGKKYNIYQFSREGNKVKARYFVRNSRALDDLKGKKILFYCSGAFSQTWDANSTPIGICVDNGNIMNKSVDGTMDGLVVVYNGGAQQGGIAVSNLDKEPINTSAGSFWVKNNAADRTNFLNWAAKESATVFQTQLMYSTKGYEFPTDKLNNGSAAERRMLAICKNSSGTVQHIVVDAPQTDYLNNSAKNIVQMLQSAGFTIIGLFNLDTGGRNVMEARDDRGKTISSIGKLDDAINLIIYYMD